MKLNRTIAKITLEELKSEAEEDGYDWKEEVMPALEAVIDAVFLNQDSGEICRLALHDVLGTPRKRRPPYVHS